LAAALALVAARGPRTGMNIDQSTLAPPQTRESQQEVARLQIGEVGPDEKGEVGVQVAVDVAANQEVAVGRGFDP
jgi:hypothetical protein